MDEPRIKLAVDNAKPVVPPHSAPSNPAAADAWPEPILPGTAKTPDIPASLLPGWVGAMAGAVAASTQTPEAASVMLCLSALATVLQRQFEVAPWNDDYREPLSLWSLIALPSGSRKSAILTALTEPMVRWERRERDRLRAEIARNFAQREVAAKRVEKLKADAGKAKTAEDRERLEIEIQQEREAIPAELIAPRIFSGDVTPERLQALLVEQSERMSVLSDEAGIFQVMSGTYSGGIANLDVFLQGHAGSPIRVDRAGRVAHLDRPALSFGLMIQPGILADSGNQKRFRDSGLLARFLYALPESNVGTRDVRERRPVPDSVKTAWEANLLDFLNSQERPAGVPRVIPFTEDAREIWLEFAEQVEPEQRPGGRLEHIADWSSKLPGAVARIAGLLEIALNGLTADAVGTDAVARAVLLGEALIEHALAAFALMGAVQAEEDAACVLRWIQARGLSEFTRREAQKAMESRFKSVDRLKIALRQLQDWHVLRQVERRTETRGRPSPCCVVNPRILSTGLDRH
ncbi:YfjI family protein [Methylocaldum sp. 14B]|uniref:YfjI family protein n=1 Tax=Methylocaldum sp. 14B TaxID=1912213 RepID=UPI00098A089A|nr:YfjI family protein [Methylocaldum sp. 14B]